jgi:23S rRNA-/tRNA-specific pseudouridylate synthase
MPQNASFPSLKSSSSLSSTFTKNVTITVSPPPPPPPSGSNSNTIDNNGEDTEEKNNRTVTILSLGPNHVIVMKPPSVICHHSSWAGTRKKKSNLVEESEIPMLQRVRDKTTRRVNLVHRLDRGASGALLFAFADDDDDDGDGDTKKETKEEEEEDVDVDGKIEKHEEIVKDGVVVRVVVDADDHDMKKKEKGATARLQEEMNQTTSTKTYIALVRGEGILKGEDLKQRGWFEVNRPIKDEKGKLNDATTSFLFVAGQKPQDGDDDEDDDKNNDNDKKNNRIMKPRMSLVLARPQHGRWHQIRRHLNGLSHHILGDRSHGCSKTNKEWKQKRNLPGERVFLHLARLQIPPTEFTPEGIDCLCPLPQDMLDALNVYAPDVLRDALPILEKEGIFISERQKVFK